MKSNMLKIFTLVFLCSFSAYAAPWGFSRVIDLGKLDAKKYEPEQQFNSAPEIGAFIESLAKDFGIEVAVETGTWKGYTTRFFSKCFKEVHTAEISEENFQIAKANLSDCSNVHCHLGSSEKVLHDILPSLKGKKVVFYLDAHWNEYWPLLSELEEIAKTHKDECILVIDDFKVPKRRDISYDKYGRHKCSYEYIQEKLDQVFSSYDYYYLIPKDVKSRAKFLAIPKSWPRAEGSVCRSNFEGASQFIKKMTRTR